MWIATRTGCSRASLEDDYDSSDNKESISQTIAFIGVWAFGSLLNKIAEHAHELSALLAAEQGGFFAQARWEIDLLTKRLEGGFQR
jgi:hypothetical protein